jgi:hypothetical protein
MLTFNYGISLNQVVKNEEAAVIVIARFTVLTRIFLKMKACGILLLSVD